MSGNVCVHAQSVVALEGSFFSFLQTVMAHQAISLDVLQDVWNQTPGQK